jgi:enoyl-CoA hydratase
MTGSQLVLIDDPVPHVRRLTLNRPEKRNALSNALRGELFAALDAADADPEIRVIIIRGAGTCFSSGYDLAHLGPTPWHAPQGPGWWARHVVDGCFRIWDLAKPVIAQVHGALLVAPNSPWHAISSTFPRTHRSVTRRCARFRLRTITITSG